MIPTLCAELESRVLFYQEPAQISAFISRFTAEIATCALCWINNFTWGLKEFARNILAGDQLTKRFRHGNNDSP